MTPVEICNDALIRVGGQTIVSLSDNSREANLCNEIYQRRVKTLLASHPWKFAQKRATLTALPDAPTWEFQFEYQLPVDCVRMTNMEGEEWCPWETEGSSLVTDMSEPNILYIGYTYETTENLFTATFSSALAADIAAHLAYSLAQSATLRRELKDEAKKELSHARTFSAQSGVGDRVYADSWLRSRR